MAVSASSAVLLPCLAEIARGSSDAHPWLFERYRKGTMLARVRAGHGDPVLRWEDVSADRIAQQMAAWLVSEAPAPTDPVAGAVPAEINHVRGLSLIQTFDCVAEAFPTVDIALLGQGVVDVVRPPFLFKRRKDNLLGWGSSFERFHYEFSDPEFPPHLVPPWCRGKIGQGVSQLAGTRGNVSSAMVSVQQLTRKRPPTGREYETASR